METLNFYKIRFFWKPKFYITDNGNLKSWRFLFFEVLRLSRAVTAKYIQVDEDSFIPIVNIGSSTHYSLKNHKRPEEVYIRVTYEVLFDVLKTEDGRQKLLRWLSYGVLPSLNMEKK